MNVLFMTAYAMVDAEGLEPIVLPEAKSLYDVDLVV